MKNTQNTLRVKMLRTVSPACVYDRRYTFHKGRIYSAFPATNQPDYAARGLVFVQKKVGHPDSFPCMLLERGDYKRI